MTPDVCFPPAINIRAREYMLFRTLGTCRHCHETIPLYAVGLAPGHETLDTDEDARDGTAADRWSVAAHHAFLFHVAHLSADVQLRLSELTPSYRLDQGAGATGCWANRCDRCDALMDDQELFCEPGGAFLPTSEADGRRIEVVLVSEGLEAEAAGYAPEPPYLSAMSRG